MVAFLICGENLQLLEGVASDAMRGCCGSVRFISTLLALSFRRPFASSATSTSYIRSTIGSLKGEICQLEAATKETQSMLRDHVLAEDAFNAIAMRNAAPRETSTSYHIVGDCFMTNVAEVLSESRCRPLCGIWPYDPSS
jgi:hypothetical protein